MSDVLEKPQATLVSYSHFAELDIRVGKVEKAEFPDWSEKLIKLSVSFGEYTEQRVFYSGIRAWYSPEDLEQKQFLFVLNIEPKKMGPDYSHGMMIMADTKDRPILFEIPNEIQSGTQVR